MPRVSPPMSRVELGSLDVTGTAETKRIKVPSALSIPLLQARYLTGKYPPAEVWVPVGITYIVTTTTTVTPPKVTLWMNGVACTGTGAVITIPDVAAAVDEFFLPFGAYVLPAAPAAGDAWSLKVTTSATAGVATVALWYITKPVAGVTEGVNL